MGKNQTEINFLAKLDRFIQKKNILKTLMCKMVWLSEKFDLWSSFRMGKTIRKQEHLTLGHKSTIQIPD
jgi:hypothetical protein